MKLCHHLGTAVVILLLIIAVFVFLTPRFDWRVDSVSSGSMEPELNVGGILITRPAVPESIKVGDIITFNSPLNNEVTSHRVIAIKNDSSPRFQTKGDANQDADPYLISAANLVGKGCFHLPYFGYVAQFIKTKLGFLLVICLPGLAVIVMEIMKIWRVLARREAENNYHIR